ncbi:D-alanyl-D-alanine carboxypeptidase [Alphaproteobacteria bacterium]|nr:D-alanyl-D-alanine carboxypeptidase [Alphaproteobacteria bacterium]
MIKIILLTVVFFLNLNSQLFAKDFNPDGCSKSNAYVVFEEKNRNILLDRNSDIKIYPASLVKLMTLYLTFEAIEEKKISLNKLIPISGRAEEISLVNKVNTLHLKRGDTITVREAILAVIVRSFNESAIALAEAVANDEWLFVRLMNLKALELGMNDTSFRNASGLHDLAQYTTARDLARLAIAIKKDFPEYYHLFALKKFKFDGKKYKTHNHILEEYFGAEGLKTGFTHASGFNLIASAYKNNSRIISVLIGCTSAAKREAFTRLLLDEAYKKIPNRIYPEISGKINKGFDYNQNSLYLSRNRPEKVIRQGL